MVKCLEEDVSCVLLAVLQQLTVEEVPYVDPNYSVPMHPLQPQPAHYDVDSNRAGPNGYPDNGMPYYPEEVMYNQHQGLAPHAHTPDGMDDRFMPAEHHVGVGGAPEVEPNYSRHLGQEAGK